MRKGQAAMEFLMTYGWAILVVLAAIGALAYFGVLSPDKFLPDKCTANPPFSCGEYKVNSTGLLMGIQNNQGVDVTVSDIKLSCDSGTSNQNATTAGAGFLVNGNTVKPTWSTADLTLAGCTGSLTTGNKFKATYTITYTKAGETTTHTGSGSIQARVE